MKCTNCGRNNRAGVRFCEECGEKLQTLPGGKTIFCPNCGAKTRPGALFCENCGEKLTSKAIPSRGTQPGPSGSEDDRPRKRGVGLLIGALLLIIVLAAAILLILTRSKPLPMFGQSSGSSNTGTIQGFFDDIFNGNNNGNNANPVGNDGNPEPGTIQGFFDDLFNGNTGGANVGVTNGNCTDKMEIVNESNPHDALLKPGEVFTKTWRLKNVGTCTWTTKYGVKLVNRSAMWVPAPEFGPLSHSVAPGEEIDVSIQIPLPDKIFIEIGLFGVTVKFELVNNQGESIRDNYMVAGFYINRIAAASRCPLFTGLKIELAYMDWIPGSALTFYLTIPGGVPGLEKNIPEDFSGNWEYSAGIGDYKGGCDFKGYKEMLFCTIALPEAYSNTISDLSVSVNYCDTPIFAQNPAYLPKITKASSSNGSTCSQPSDSTDSLAWEAYCKCIGKSEAISGGTIHCE